MRFVDFLIHILKAHAQTLQRLAAFFGEEELLQLLETAGESNETTKAHPDFVNPKWFGPPLKKNPSSNAYRELENSAKELQLPEVLEFHLWAYPFYRTLVESPVELEAQILIDSTHMGLEKLIQEAIIQSQEWMKTLPISPVVSAQAERIASLPWLRFRTEMLKRAGRRPIETVKTD